MNFLFLGKLKFVIFGLLFVAVIGFVMFQPNRLRYSSEEGPLSINDIYNDRDAQIKAFENINKIDIDNDGLKDWEEVLWKTDPKNQDTDGDGMIDGDEVQKGSDPLKSGPDDKYKNTVVKESNSNISNLNKELTETDKFSQKFFQNYISLHNLDGSFSEDDKNNFINTSLNEITGAYTTKSNYTESDLNISYDTSNSNVKEYGNALGEIILKHSFETEDEMTIFNRSVTNSDTKEIEKLNPIINGYKNILKDSIALSVPKDAIDEHIAFIEGITVVAQSIEDMQAIYSDPIRAIIGIGSHEQSVGSLEDAFGGMKKYFNKKGIIFNESENGYVMTSII